MARRHEADQPYVWRAVVTHTWPNGRAYTDYCGPFSAKGHATASGKREAKAGWGSSVGRISTVEIQRSPLVWQDVPVTTKESQSVHDLDSIVVEVRCKDDEGPYWERIKFLDDDRLRTEGLDIPLWDGDEILYVKLKNKVIE